MGNGPNQTKAPQQATKPPVNPAVVAGATKAATAEDAKKSKTVITTVKMKDGRSVDFPGKRKIQKEGGKDANGLNIRFDFINGETRTFTLTPSLMDKFAIHGAGQKITDEAAGETDIDDAIVAIDSLLDRLKKGEWTAERASGGMSGASILLKALVTFTGKTPEQMRAFLEGKTANERTALRNSDKVRDPKVGSLKSIVTALEAEKAAKSKSVDTEALLSGLDAV